MNDEQEFSGDALLMEALGIPKAAIPDMTREQLVAARKEIAATEPGSPLRSLAIRLLAEARKVRRLRQSTERYRQLVDEVAQTHICHRTGHGHEEETCRQADLPDGERCVVCRCADAQERVTPAAVEQCMDDIAAIREHRKPLHP